MICLFVNTCLASNHSSHVSNWGSSAKSPSLPSLNDELRRELGFKGFVFWMHGVYRLLDQSMHLSF